MTLSGLLATGLLATGLLARGLLARGLLAPGLLPSSLLPRGLLLSRGPLLLSHSEPFRRAVSETSNETGIRCVGASTAPL